MNTDVLTVATVETKPVFDLERVIAELDNDDWHLPVEAFHALRAHRELAVPRLIQLLEEVVQRLDRDEVVESVGAMFALHLLAEFQAREAWPVLSRLMCLPRNLLDPIFGDAVFETFNRVIMQLADDPLAYIAGVLGQRDLDPLQRTAIAGGVTQLVQLGRLTRAEGVQFVGQYLRTAVAEHDDPEFVSMLICNLLDLAPRELENDLSTAFKAGVVDESIVDWTCVEDSFAATDAEVVARLTRRRSGEITDALGELQSWACFQKKPESDADFDEQTADALRASLAYLLQPIERFDPLAARLPTEEEYVAREQPILSDRQRVRPNDHCSCGSGKKYKRCCGKDG